LKAALDSAAGASPSEFVSVASWVGCLTVQHIKQLNGFQQNPVLTSDISQVEPINNLQIGKQIFHELNIHNEHGLNLTDAPYLWSYSGVRFGQTVFSQLRKQTGIVLIAMSSLIGHVIHSIA
jgi:hypothetical protein